MKVGDGRGVLLAIGLALAGATLAPATALAKGGFHGKFGKTPFKAMKIGLACTYAKQSGFFEITGVSKPKIHLSSRTADIKWAQMGGVGADPTAPGAAFPIQLTSAEAGFVSVKGVGLGSDPSSFPGWVTQGASGFTITFTGYKKGKIVGTFSGTLEPGENNPNGAIQSSGAFAASCIIQ